jgi:hypothetical protein
MHDPRNLNGSCLMSSFIVRLVCAALVFGIKLYTSAVASAAMVAGAMLAFVLVEHFAKPSTEWIARMYVRRERVTIELAVAALVVGLALIVTSHTLGVPSPTVVGVLQFVVEGMILGAATRAILSSHFDRTLRGMSSELLHLHLHVVLSAFLVLVPTSLPHRALAGWFVTGIGLGFFLHYWQRHREHRRTRRQRILKHVVSASVRIADPAFELEKKCIKAFADERWNKLDQLIESSPTRRTVLELLRIARAHRAGQYQSGIEIATEELTRTKSDHSRDNLLNLALAVCHGELGDRSAMYRALNRAIELKPDCTTSHALIALRTAEDVPVTDATYGVRRLRGNQSSAFLAHTKAITYAQSGTPARVEALIVGSMISMSSICLVDMQAYVMLKSGYGRTVAPMLLQCIHEDPYFSLAYLHLGEYHLIRGLMISKAAVARGDGERLAAKAAKELRLARLCIRIARCLEGDRQNLVALRAEELLTEAQTAVVIDATERHEELPPYAA